MPKRIVMLFMAGASAVTAGGSQPPQGRPPFAHAPLVVRAERYDRSAPLRNLKPLPPVPKQEPDEREPRPWRRAGRGRRIVDPVAQTSPLQPLIPQPSTTFEGIGNVNAVLPPDTTGDVGPNHYVQWVNLSFAVFSKGTGTTPPSLVYGPAAANTLWAGFGGPCETRNDGDPVVLYDHLADRWVMSQLALPNSFFGIVFAPFYQCVAVSATSDPLGAYNRYQFRFDKLNDYPKLGLAADAYYMSINQFTPFSLQFAGQGVVAFDRQSMLAGLPASMIYFDLAPVDMNLGGMLPMDLDGPAPPSGAPEIFAQVDDDGWGYAPDQLQLWQFHVDWTTPAASSFTGPTILPTAPFDSNLCDYARNCIPQPGTTVKVDALADRLMYRLQYRHFASHDSLVVNHTVDVDGGDHAGIRWYEIRDPLTTPVLYQQGTYAPDANHRWMGSAAMDGSGNLALGFSVSGPATSPSIRYTGRLAGDAPGVMTQGEADLMAGSGSQTQASGRWGDYSMLAVDPADNCTFWYTQQYYASTSDAAWQTRVGTFRFPSCGGAPPPPPPGPGVSVTAAIATATEAGLAAGAFRVSRAGDASAPLTVRYGVTGTATAGADYAALPGSVTMAPGASEAIVGVTPIDDPFVEPNETIVLTLTADPSYSIVFPASATVTLVSDDVPADLIVSTLTAPSVSGAGAALAIAETTKNQGSGSSLGSITSFYLSTNTVLDASDVPLGSRSVPPLPAGASDSGATTAVIPAGTAAGTYFVVAKADAGGANAESQEGNNVKASGAIAIGPDLVVSALSVPVAAGAGGPIAMTDTTANQGGGAAAASLTSFYLSANTAIDAGDTLLGQRAVPALAPGGTSTGQTSWIVPQATAGGLYYVLATADGARAVGETQELNNVRLSAVRIGPDLVVSTVSAPAIGAPGGSMVVADTTKNQGGGNAAASTTSFYLSANLTVDSADILIGSRPVASLDAGTAASATTTALIPPGAAAGAYFLLAKADSTGAVPESSETNNVTAGPLVAVGPDLTIAALTVPAAATTGASIVVNDTTKNNGAAPSGPSTTFFYLSANLAVDAADVLLGSRSVPALAASATDTAATTISIPAGTAAGTFFIIGVADGPKAIAEGSEANNTRWASIRITTAAIDR